MVIPMPCDANFDHLVKVMYASVSSVSLLFSPCVINKYLEEDTLRI